MADTALHDKSPAELHSLGLGCLSTALDSGTDNAAGSRMASTAIACFFASMSADNLAAEVGAHRTDEHTPPHGTPAVAGANEHAVHHG